MKSTRDSPSVPVQPNVRRRAVLETARKLGLLGGENRRIGGRVCRDLVAAAKKKSGITSDTELIEYALAEVAPKTTSARDSSVAKAGSRKTSTLSFDLLRALRRIKPHRIVENIGKSKPNGAPRTVLIVRCGESGTLCHPKGTAKNRR